MNYLKITLKDFFAGKEAVSLRPGLGATESSKALVTLKERLLKEAKDIEWPSAFGDIVKKAEGLLDIDIGGIMVTAWNKYLSLRKYLDKSKYSPDEEVLVPLSEHTIRSEHHPFVEILINNAQAGKLEFAVNVSLVLKGMVLTIQNGRIMEIRTGSCKAKGSITCEGAMIIEKELQPITLPGSISLGEGVPII